MDPVTTAIIAGVVAGFGQTAQNAVADAYGQLKAVLKRKFGDRTDLIGAVNALDAKPESDARRKLVEEEVAASGVLQDADVLDAAQSLLAILDESAEGKTIQQAIGSYIAQADRHGHAEIRVNQPPTQA